MSLRLRLLEAVLRRTEKRRLARVADPLEARRGFARAARLFHEPPFALFLPDRLGTVPALWVAGRGARGPGIMLHVHGGAFVMGSARTHRGMLARLSELTGLPACLPDYRLAPEHPFPAGFDDVRAAWDGLVARGYAPGRIVLSGDSAGGGLMLGLLAQLCRAGTPPAAVLGFAPWADLTLSGASLNENAARDPILPAWRVLELRDIYLAGAPPDDPRASPLLDSFPGCPPVFLQAAEAEILRDDTLRMAARLRAQGAAVETDIGAHGIHVLAILQGRVPEADAALARAARFVRAVTGRAPAGS